jgi:hypothetical protein
MTLPTPRMYLGVHRVQAYCKHCRNPRYRTLDLQKLVDTGRGDTPLIELPLRWALVRKSVHGYGAAVIAAFQAIRCDTGMPSRVIRLSSEQAALASVFWAGRVRA